MSIVSMRFAYKERRVGKITENGLTWLTSTPSNPYGSKAEACQPLRAISAACQGAGHGSPPRGAGRKQGVMDRLADFPKCPYKRRKRIFVVVFP